MFLGTHTPKLDDKGRLILPAKYRNELADGLVITRFQEHAWPSGRQRVRRGNSDREECLHQPATGPGLPADARLGSFG